MSKITSQNYAVILSGGSGTRLWPLSCKCLPKQYLSFGPSGKTFLELTLERSKKIASPKNHIVITTQNQNKVCRSYLKKANYQGDILVEPIPKNTSPAIALAAFKLLKKDPESFMTILPTDLSIKNTSLFKKTISEALKLAEKNCFVVIGVEPTHPATEFGYIEIGKKMKLGFHVKSFHEKPDYKTAEKFLKKGRCFWNSGIFIWKTKTFWNEFLKIQPKMAKKIMHLKNSNAKMIYKTFENVPIDIAFLEKTNKIACIKSKFDWHDIGSWATIRESFPRDRFGNLIHGNVYVMDVKNCVVHSKGPFIAAIGLENMGVIATPDAVLVTNLSQAQKVKNVPSAFRQHKK